MFRCPITVRFQGCPSGGSRGGSDGSRPIELEELFIDPNDYRDDIETLVAEQTGRTLTIEGELELSVWLRSITPLSKVMLISNGELVQEIPLSHDRKT